MSRDVWRGRVWLLILVEVGYLWAQLPDVWWRLFVVVAALTVLLVWFDWEWTDRYDRN